jgi:beta-galactosidase
MNLPVLPFLRLLPLAAAAAFIGPRLVAADPAPAAAGALGTTRSLSPAPSYPILGSSWYPEQWPESRWNADLALMQAAGLKMVRVGEYAWSSLEPSEGRYTLDWLDRAITLAASHGLAVVIGTPSDAPPAWLTAKYPETLLITEEGKPLRHGMRRQFSYASPRYRQLCRAVAEQLGKRFGHNPAVVGWQIGNEFTDDSFDPEARRQFHEWLRARYGSLDALNARWVTADWSQSYDTWEEIPLGVGRGNPGLLLDYKRFVTDTWRSFQRNQIDAIRPHSSSAQFITTNLGGLGWADPFNRRTLTEDLDLASWDDEVGSGHLDPFRNGATNDLVRGWKGRNFWVMEMQPGTVDWAPIPNSLDKGETRAMAWETVGHGADCVAFWQWRSALGGQEQYHGNLVGPDGQPAPFYAEAKQIATEFTQASAALAGTTVKSEVAILHDYESRWAIDFHPHSTRYDQVKIILQYYQPLRELGQSVDIVDPRVPLDGYKLVLAPSLNVISAELARHLADYVKQGGHLLLGPRSGMKDGDNALNPERQPGPLAATLGGRVEQFFALPDSVPVAGQWGSGSSNIWAEMLSAGPDAEVLMRYGRSNGWLDGQPAAIQRKVDGGTLAYLGADLDPILMSHMTRSLLRDAGVKPSFPLPAGVELCRRVGPGKEVLILISFNATSTAVNLPSAMSDVLHGGQTTVITLPKFGVAVLAAR